MTCQKEIEGGATPHSAHLVRARLLGVGFGFGFGVGLGLGFEPALCTPRALHARLPPSRSEYSAAAWVGSGLGLWWGWGLG